MLSLKIAAALLAWKPCRGVKSAVRLVPARKGTEAEVHLDLWAIDGQAPESIQITSVPTPGELKILDFAARQVLEAAWGRPALAVLDTAGMGVG